MGGSGGYAPGDRLWLGHSLTPYIINHGGVFCFSDMHGLILVRYGIIVSTYTVVCIVLLVMDWNTKTTQHLAINTQRKQPSCAVHHFLHPA